MTPLSLSAEDWPRFSALLDACLEQAPDDREAWIDALPAADARFRTQLSEVAVAAQPRCSGDWLDAPVSGDDTAADAAGFGADQLLGPWRLLRALGRGGMGEVWLAARADGAYAREVALKLPHAFLLAGAQRDRFARERDILAGLAHPGIARLYDAGVAGEQPWLALEFIEGVPITDYAERNALALPARIALLRQVAAALQAAHARLVVHRDLKPANVLVTPAGEVKLLDFGIAKLLGSGDDSDLTGLGGRPATPDYAAPEQLAGGHITVATDVYALGLLGYELLARARPFPRSSRLGRMVQARGDAPLASTLAPPALRRALAGDLDAILARAVDPEPGNRYASVDALAQDLERHLLHRPIAARRIGRAQRAARFLRRHRTGAAVTAALVLLLAAGIGGVLWQAQRAQAEARRATAIKDFLLEIFSASDPRIASDTPRGAITARALLDAGAARVETRFADDPDLQIELLRTIANLYAQLGEDARYEALQALQLRKVRARYGPHHPNLLDGAVEAALRACSGAEPACGSKVSAADRLLPAAGDTDPERRAQWWLARGMELRALDGRVDDAGHAYRQAVALYARHAPRTPGHVTALHELAGFQQSMQLDYAGAIATFRRAQALAASLPGRNDAELQTLHGNLGLLYQQAGRFSEAAAEFRKSAQYAERTTGAAFPTAWVPRANAARTLHLAGDREAALREFATVLPLLPKDGRYATDAAAVHEAYGERLSAEGRPALGIPHLEAAAKVYATQSAFTFKRRLLQRFLGEAHARAGHQAVAGRMLEASLADYLAHQDPDGQPVMAARESYGRWLLDVGRADDARTQFSAVLASAGERPFAHVALAQAGVARLALARGDAAAATRDIDAALATWKRVEGFRDVRMGPYLMRVHADVLAARGEVAQAQRIEDAAALASARFDAPESSTRVRRRMAAPGTAAMR